jgi:hypothetical protein
MAALTTKEKKVADYITSFKWDVDSAKALISKLLFINGSQFQSGFLALAPDLTVFMKLREFAGKMKSISEYQPPALGVRENANLRDKHDKRVTYVKDNIKEIEKLCDDYEISAFKAYRSYLMATYVAEILTLGTKHDEIVALGNDNRIHIKKKTFKTFKERKSPIELIIEAYEELNKENLSVYKAANVLFAKGAKLESLCLTETAKLSESVAALYKNVQKYYTALAAAQTPAAPPAESKYLYPGELFCMLHNNETSIANGTTFESNQTNNAAGEYSRRYVITGTKFVIHGHYRRSGKRLCNLHIKHVEHEFKLNASTWIEKYYYDKLIVLAPNLKVEER